MRPMQAGVTPGRLRVAVIGAGSMGRNHARVFDLLRDVDFIGIADPDPAARVNVAEHYGVATFADYRELFGRIDAASVAVPTALHRAVAIDCFKAGVHVMMEKPIAANTREAVEILSAARASGCILQVGHIERFNPAVAALGPILAGERIVAVSAERLSPPTPRVIDVDVVFDLMIHDIDIAMALVGAPPAVLGALGRPSPPARLDHVTAHGRTDQGVLLSFTASKITQETVRRLQVTTERAYVTVNYLNRDIAVHRGGELFANATEGYAYVEEGSLTRPHVSAVEPLRAELEHFVACVRSGTQPLTSGESALDALRVAEDIQRLASA